MNHNNRHSDSVELQTVALGNGEGGGAPRLHFGYFSGDNFGYFVEVREGVAVAVDVPHGARMLSCLEQRGWSLSAILLTHTHHDHVSGLEEVLERTGCELIAPAGADTVSAHRRVKDGERFQVESLTVEALNTSGHSELDFSYWLPDQNICFCGDTLFAWGCGRMFAGPPERLWASIQRLRALPVDPWLACGHDYAEDNLLFMRQHLCGIPRFADFMERAGDYAAMPVRLSEQIEHNPFLRADDPEIAEALDMKDADPVEVFACLRERRNRL